MDDLRACTSYLLTVGPFGFDCVLGDASERLVGSWTPPEGLFARLESVADPLLADEIYARV
jgi:hypothetical protein